MTIATMMLHAAVAAAGGDRDRGDRDRDDRDRGDRDRDEGDSRRRRGRSDVPTWLETVDLLVKANIENHKKKGGNGGGRGRRRGR